MKNFIRGIRRVKFHDFLQVWKLIIAIIPSLICKLFHHDLWLVCEDENEARDNGYWFFKYVRENHPEQECYYAIHQKSVDYQKVASLGKTVEYGSLKHWILYLASSRKISSQKAGNPNAAIFYFLEVYGILKDKRIFLQHGITVNDAKWLYYQVTKMNSFICGAYPEYEYILEHFGYPKGNVVYTGFCRFDQLHHIKPDQKLILIMPTWREWIADEDYRLELYEGTKDIAKTNYFVQWKAFIEDEEIKRLAETYNVQFLFFPHRNMQKYMEYFPKGNEYIQIVSNKDWDIQKLLKTAALMITDYSSVFFDFIYMKKPLVFYQFDYDMFRKGQYGQGMFDYRNNDFASSYTDRKEVFKEVEYYLKNNYEVSEKYIEEHHRYFPLYDQMNCARVYDVVKDCK